MSEPRLKTAIRVQAMLRTAAASGHFGVVARRGDADAGSVLVQLRGRAGFCVLSALSAEGGEPTWLRATGPDPVDEAAAEAYVARQVGRDPDVWVVEFETPDLALPFAGRLRD